MILATTLAALCPLSSGLTAAPHPSFLSLAATVSAASPVTPRLTGGPDVKELAAKLAKDQPVEDRIGAAQELAALGKKTVKVLPALITALNDTEPQVVDSVVVALQSIGKKAREPLQAILISGEYEGAAISQPAVIKTLLGMGGKAMGSVGEHMDAMELGPDKIQLMASLGSVGLPYFAEAFGVADGAFDVEMMRTLRTTAAQAPREADSIAPALKKIKDTALKLALETAWLQQPEQAFVTQYSAWITSDQPVLIDTGLWALGLMGKDGAAHAADVAKHLDASDATTRATAAWALASFLTPGPGPSIAEIPASFPGASKDAEAQLKKSMESEVYTLWSNSGKPLGYRGRIGTKARGFWALAPTWTATTPPVPETPDRTKIAKELLAAEDQLFKIASGGTGVDARLASDALAAFGNTEDRCRDLWLQWLSSDEVPLIQSGLIGLRAIGRDIIMMEKQPEVTHEMLVASHLNRPETMVAAAQLLTKIMTPTAWSSVVSQMALLEGKPPMAMIAAIGRYDVEALRPYLPRMQELYEEGNYMYAAFLIKFGAETLTSFEKELSSKLTDRRMVAIESLGHIGKDARALLPRLRSIKDKNTIIQKLVTDAVKRIQ